MAITLVQRNKSKGVLTWYARVPDSKTGRAHYFSLGTTSKAEAKAIPKRKRVKPERHFWTTDQVDRIVAMAPNPETRLTWALMAFAGLRKSEATAIRPEKIHDGYIHLVGKGDKPAKIPMCPRLKREIDRFNAAGGKWEKLHCNEYTITRIAAQALPGGFLGKAHAHRFRHSFGSNLIRAGVNVKVVQHLMRHESIQMTLDIYGHILDADAEKAIEKAFP